MRWCNFGLTRSTSIIARIGDGPATTLCFSRGNDHQSPAVSNEVESGDAQQDRSNESTQSVIQVHETKLNSQIKCCNNHRNTKQPHAQEPPARKPFGRVSMLLTHPQPPDKRHEDESRNCESQKGVNKLSSSFLKDQPNYQECPELHQKPERQGPKQPSPNAELHRPTELSRCQISRHR